MNKRSQEMNDVSPAESPAAMHEFLKKELLSDDIEVRWDAILALEKMPGENATDLLIEALKR